jgi:hypothetical protein
MRGEIMKNFIILLLTVFILSCATAPPQILDDGFKSSQPNFQVQFHQLIVEKSIKSRRYQHWDGKSYLFMVDNREGILIQISTFIQSRSGVYFYGPDQILTNMGRMVLDPVVINGRQWIKFVDVFNSRYLFTGYFRFMDRSSISVGRIYDAGAYAAEIKSFRKGATLSHGQGKLWEEAFAHTDQLFSIGKVALAESKSERPLSAKEIKTIPEKTKTEAEKPPLEKEKPKLAAIPKGLSGAKVSLRKEPMKISNEMKIVKMLIEYDFFDNSRNPLGSFGNDLVDNNDGTVTDRATGLIWEKNGSNQLYNRKAKEYIERLNTKRFAGYSDWRMPTVEELASLLARKKESGVHLDPVFDHKQSRCWTADKSESRSWSWYKAAWLIDFKNGGVNEAYWSGEGSGAYSKNSENYVKAVRSVK